MLTEFVPGCGCHHCLDHFRSGAPGRPSDVFALFPIGMVLCPDCGNKRCPHANDHRWACTASNDTGQLGSAYP